MHVRPITGADSQMPVVIDQCPGGTATQVFCNNGKNVIITPSTIYDNGAFSNNCGNRSNCETYEPKMPSLTFSDYYNEPSVRFMMGHMPAIDCAKFGISANEFAPIRDNIIYGTLMIAGKPYEIIVAQMGKAVSSVKVGKNQVKQVIRFSHVVQHGLTLYRGSAPSNTQLKPLHHELYNANLASMTTLDKLLAYTELVAKHWGDLGMVFDAIGTQRYVLSDDTILKVICAQLGVNFADTQNLYTAAIPNNRAHLVNNSGSAFFMYNHFVGW